MVPNHPALATETRTDTAAWLNDAAAFADWLAIDGDAAIAIDTEFVRERTYWPVLALVQVAVSTEQIALLDPTIADSLPALGRALCSRERTVLMHSAGEDLIALKPVLASPMIDLYDTQIAGAYAGLGLGLGYQGTVEKLTGVRLEKQETRSNWLARPLSLRQIEYALDDVRYLHELHAQLDERLGQRGYREWHREDCRRLARDNFELAPDLQPQLDFRGCWRWSMLAQAQLRRILQWREEAARARNLPRRWVLDDDSALAAAIQPEHSAARLATRLADGPPGRSRSLQPLLNLLERLPDTAELEATSPIAAPLEGERKQLLKRLKDEVDREATRLDLPAGLLCPRRALEALATNHRWPADLAGWRQNLLEQRLLDLC
jgi:ribonuclease D